MAMKGAHFQFFSVIKPLQWGLALVLFLLLGACSSTTFLYNRLDFILPWYLDDYVDLNRDQKVLLDTSLKPFLRWHRATELPRYVQVLNNIEHSLDRPVTHATAAHIFSEVELAWLRLEDEALGWLLELGAGLTDGQIEEFLGVLQEQQGEYEQEYLERSDAQYLKDSYDNFEDSLQDYLGRLNQAQREVLHEASTDLMRMDTPWLHERAIWLEKLSVLLQRKPGWQRRLREQKAAREQNYSPQYLTMYGHNLEVIQGALSSVIDSRSAKQDRRLRNKIKNLKEDLETLIAQGASQ